MLELTGLINYYYVPGVTAMRCGYYRLAGKIKEELHRDPYNGDVFIFMSKDRKKLKLLRYVDQSYLLYEKVYANDLRFLKIECGPDGKPVCKIEWRELVGLLSCPSRKVLPRVMNVG